MTKCRCGFVDEENPKGYIKKFCDNCIKDKDSIGFPYFKETIVLKSYGTVSKTRVAELNKQTHIPGKDGEYYIGTKRNGKIHEKSPDISK